jgi:hypothetical protein
MASPCQVAVEGGEAEADVMLLVVGLYRCASLDGVVFEFVDAR